MNKLRLRMAFVCGVVFATPAFAQLTTVGPDTPGVKEYEQNLVFVAPSGPDFNFYLPKWSGV